MSAHDEAESDSFLQRCGFTVQNVGQVGLQARGFQMWPQVIWKLCRSLVKAL